MACWATTHPGLRGAFPAVIGSLVCVHASMAATRVAASLLVLHQGYPNWMVGALLSLFAVAPIALSLWAGRQADRHGMHRNLGVGVLLGAGGALIAVISQQPVALALAALATGGAVSVAAVGIQREAGLMARDASDLKRVFSWVALGPAASNALAPIAVGLLIDHVGFRAGFALAAALPLLAWLFGCWVPRHTPAPKVLRPGQALPSGVWGLLRLGPLQALLLVNLALSSCWDSHSFVVPVIGHARGLSASSIGLILGGFAVAATVVRLAISRWADDLDERLALRCAMGLATAVCAVYAWLPGLPGMLVGSAVLGLALGSVQPMVLAMLHQVTPDDRHGQALGLRMLVTNGATITMPLVFGALAAATVPASPMWLMGALVALAQWPVGRVRPRAAPEPASIRT